MKLAEALSIIRNGAGDAPAYPVLLACGFTPLHLSNFLAAHLEAAAPGLRRVQMETGLYDDPAGTLEGFAQAERSTAAALALEWSDLDPRLGFRQLGGWGPRLTGSILETAATRLERFHAAIARLSSSGRLAVSLPTLPLPPGFGTSGWQASEPELMLRELVERFGRRIAAHPSVLVVNTAKLDRLSPRDHRYDFRSDLHAGFPYTLAHADALGNALALLLAPPQPKKGLITDLDDTFWSGLVGEIGAENVAWDLASHNQMHGLYQQMLGALADSGALVAVASKNSLAVVEPALARTDLAMPRDKMFPLEIHWNAKSGSVNRILQTWNIAADSVVFVDDNPMELEEVRAAHPGIVPLRFPKGDYAAGLALLEQLRDLFGKPRLSEEDAFRLDSIRRGQEFHSAHAATASPEEFLAQAEATVTLAWNPPPSDKRVVELVNKTNQFNLNGLRSTDADWHGELAQPGAFALAVSYADKFGPLGKIAVLRGTVENHLVHLHAWVMSCRAFSRRIEHGCLKAIFDTYGASQIVFHFSPTAKNGPMQDFLSELTGEPLGPAVPLSRARFDEQCPALYSAVESKRS